MLQSSITLITFFIISWRITGVVNEKEEHVKSTFENGVKASIVLVPGRYAYSHTIYIGSKSEKFNVALSLRSPMLWIPNIDCKFLLGWVTHCAENNNYTDFFLESFCGRLFAICNAYPIQNEGFQSAACTSRNKFHSKDSTTFSGFPGSWSQQTHGAVSGVQGRDNLKIGSANERQLLVNCIFGMATVVSDDFGKNLNLLWAGYDGMLGLGVNPDSKIPSDPFLVQLNKSKALDRTMLTIYMNQKSIASNAGIVTYGGEDPANCALNIIYHKLISYTFVQVKTISMGIFKISQTTMMPELVPAIVGPKTDVDNLAKSVGAKLGDGYYEIGCGASVPSFKFTIGNVEYAITSDKLIMKDSRSSTGCVLAFKSHPVPGDPRWYFGAPLFMQYCVTFDYTKMYLGFVDVKSATTLRPGTTLRLTTRKKLAPVLHYAGIFASAFIALSLI